MVNRFLLVLLFLASVILSACESSETGQSNLRLLLTDAPADEASQLVVQFGAIKLITSGDEEGESGLTVSDSAGSFDVLTLRNGTTALLSDKNIPDGIYSQLRLIIEEATITIDDKDNNVKIPSGAQSGLKINIDPPLVAQKGQISTIILDFNANRVIETGNGSYIMSPTAIRATSVSGTLQGTLQDKEGNLLANGLVTVTDASGIAITETKTAEDGLFKIISLNEGSYTVEVSLEDYESQTFIGVSIQENETTKLTETGVVNLELAPTP